MSRSYTITTNESVYHLTDEEYRNATENGFLNHLGEEEILSVTEPKRVDWRRCGY